MKQVDRFLRIIFQECSLQNHLESIFGSTQDIFSLDNNDFCNTICKRYLDIYPHNYSFDEVQALLQGVCDEIRQESQFSKQGNLSPLYIFIIYANKLFMMKENQITVSFEHLLEWDGFATKVDPLVFQAAFLSGKSASSGVSLQVRHDENRFYKLLSQGAYETHMHLNGSGGSWEINWDNLACCPPITCSLKLLKQKSLQLDVLTVFRLQAIRTFLLAAIKGKTPGFPIEVLTYNCEHVFFKYKETLQPIYHQCAINTPEGLFSFQETAYRERYLFEQLFKSLQQGALSIAAQNLFMVYLSLMCQIRMRFVQDNVGMGFDKFKQKESIKECFFQKGDEVKLLKSVLDKYYSEGFVEGIELRIAPKSKRDLIKKTRAIQAANSEVYNYYRNKNPNIKKLELGVIIHYIKNDENDICMSGNCRHAKLREKIEKESVQLTQYFDVMHAELQEVPIIGVDAANTEIYCGPEVFAPVFRRHREEISQYSNFGFTFHIGEDFLNISSGLRSIDEVIEFFDYVRGDRLGHAIALGIHVEEYLVAKRNTIIGTVQSMTDDYVWLYHMIMYSGNVQGFNLLARLENHYLFFAQKLFQDTGIEIPSISCYWKSYLLRADDPDYFFDSFHKKTLTSNKTSKINWHNKMHNKAIESKEACELYLVYHYNKKFRNNGKVSTYCSVDSTYVEAVKIAQNDLREKIYRNGISIETNPTSNKRISHVSRYDELPLLNFNSYHLQKDNTSGALHLQASINTDDSAIFQTNLGNEYSCVAASLLSAGYEKESVFAYMDHIRMFSKATTFLTNRWVNSK